MGLDTSNVSSPLYPFPIPFLLGDLVNANPDCGMYFIWFYKLKRKTDKNSKTGKSSKTDKNVPVLFNSWRPNDPYMRQ